MADDQLQVLGDLHVVDAEVDGHVGERLGLAAAVAEHRIAAHAHSFGLLERFDDVRRIAAARERDQYVALCRLHRELHGEDLIVTAVVAKACEDRTIRRKRMHFQSGSEGLRNAVEEIVCEMHGIARATAITAQKNLATMLPALEKLACQFLNVG